MELYVSAGLIWKNSRDMQEQTIFIGNIHFIFSQVHNRVDYEFFYYQSLVSSVISIDKITIKGKNKYMVYLPLIVKK